MTSTLLPPDAAFSSRRDARTTRNITKIAYNSLLDTLNELHITDEEREYLKKGLTEAYLERIAGLYLEKKLEHIIGELNDNLCTAIGGITDSFKNNECFNLKYKF